ncbi:unnamed protein product [Closterium sp. NIES-54]
MDTSAMSPLAECLAVGAAASSVSPDDATCVAMPGGSTPPALLPDHILLRCLAAVPFPLYRSLQAVCAAWRHLADPLALHQIRRAEGLTELWRVDLENEYRDAAFHGLAGKARRHLSRPQPPRGLARQRSSSSNDMNRIDMSACAHADAAAPCGRCRTSEDASDVRVTPLAGPLRLQYGAVGIPREPELLVLGGRSPFPVFCREVVRAYADAHVYNALTDSWRALAPMPTARFAFGVAAWTYPSTRQTYVAVAGGYASSGEALFDAELYHVSSNTWTTLPPLTHASGACRAVVHGNKLIVAQRTGGPAESLDLAALLSSPLPTSPPALDAIAQSVMWQQETAETRDRLVVPPSQQQHQQNGRAPASQNGGVARYSSPATAALSRLMLPYLFLDLAAFATVTDLITHLHTSDTRYRAALPAEDHFLSLCPTTLTVDLLKKRLLAAETSITAVGASRGDQRTPFFEGCSPVPLLPSVASAAAVNLVGTESVSAASAPSERRHLATFTRRPGSSLYTLTREPPLVAASGQVAASSQVFAAASRSGPESAPCSCRLLSHQTLLWHHRIGHPSLPRLRGMASRVLVSGLPWSLPPLPPGPAPTCVPCVEGRQRAVPHSSEFPPTEAPLQTLHMDVWGPARVRGQGHERYFSLVVDDYSHYTTVFPLRSKGEVPEVLIDWIRAARLQLRERFGSDFPVLRLHSDRDGEFSSDLLRAFCRAEGIRQTFTLPASPQQNGIAECRIVMVMDVARTSMIHAASPHFLWPFAVHYAAHQINLQPRVSLPETSPTMRWTGQVGDASAFRAWGSRAFVRDLSADKLSSRAVPCGPAPSGVSQVDAIEPVEVATDSGASRGAEPRCAESRGAAPGSAESGGAGPGGAEPGGAGSGGVEPERAEPGGAASGGAGAASPVGACTGGTGAAGPAGAPGAGAGGAAGVGATGGTGAGAGVSACGPAGAGAGAAGGTGTGGAAGVGADTEGAGVVPAGSGGAARLRPYFVPLLEQLASPLRAPSPYAGPTGGLAKRREPESRPVLPVRTARTSPRVPRPRPPAVPGTHQMALRPSTAPQRVPLPSPPTSSLPALADPASDSLRAASPTVTRFLTTVVTDPSFESTAASALVTELVDFASHCRLDFAASLVAESASVCPPSVGAMDAEMASWKSTGTYVNEVPPPGANIVSGMWIFKVKRPPSSPPVFKARYVARGFSQRQGVDYFQTFSPTPKMTTLQVLLHVAAQRDYELHSLDFSTAFLQGSLHEEIWLRRPPSFTGSFPPGTQWSLLRPVYDLRQVPHEWHDTLRTTLAALGFAPSTADPSLFLRTDTLVPPFYILVYVDDLVFATADTAGLAHVKSELQKRHTCTNLGELRIYLGLQITRDRARRTITLTQSHMVQQVLQRFDFTYSSPQATPLSTRHSLSALPSDESVEPSGPYAELVGCLMYLMTCTRPDLAYLLSILAHYVAPRRHRPEHMAAAKRVLRYLCSTLGLGLVLGGRSPVVLSGYADASWVDDLATQRSSQGYTFSLGAMAAQELRWLTYLLTDLGEPPRSPPVLYVDNKAMLALCREHRLEHRTKHIALRYFFARELQQRGQLRLAYVASQANTADIFTKALQPCDHQRFCTMLGLVPTWPHLLTS